MAATSDEVHGDKVEGNKVEVGSITGTSGPVNIAGGDITQNIVELSEAEQLAARRKAQVERVQQAAIAFAQAQHELLQKIEQPTIPDRPYKGLYYFTEDDIAIFYGREDVSKQLMERLMRSELRVFVLHAPSGTGKTSLIQAGIIPQLLRRGCYTLWVEPNERLPYPRNVYQVFKELAPGIEIDDLPWEDFLGTLKAALELSPKKLLVIFLDQFERYLSSPASLEPLKDHLAAMATSRLPIRLVVSIRSDYFGTLDEKLGETVPRLVENRHALRPLSREQALEAITKPLEDRSVSWEAKAAQAVLDYLGRGDIEPPHLQLICDQLHEKAISEGHSQITCADVGEADLEALHRQYLNKQMRALREQQELGWLLLKELIRSDGLSQPRLLIDLVALFGSEITGVARKLIERRILRSTGSSEPFDDEPIGETQLAISHDILGQEILARQSPQEKRRREAIEFIRHGLDDWLNYPEQPLMGIQRLSIVDEYQDVLWPPLLGDGVNPKLELRGLEFILRSALAVNHKVMHWFRRAMEGGVEAETIVLEELKSSQYRTRVAALQTLADLGMMFIQSIIEMLSDFYPQVRITAIRMLEKLQPSGEWRGHLKYECYIPAGKFIMGTNNSDNSVEKPAHEVEMQAFYIGRYLVTNLDYQRYRLDQGQPFEIPTGMENHPVTSVSWYDARDYAAWAGVRLLSEAEWEKAASWEPCMLVKREYPWGDMFDKANCNTKEADIGTTTQVGKYSPQGDSPYGCADMSGNVWEWTSSLHKEYPYNSQDGREDSHSSNVRVVRGGSWNYHGGRARCVYRDSDLPSDRFVNPWISGRYILPTQL